MTIRRHLPPAAARKLLRDAGPPNTWVVVAMVASLPFLMLATATSGAVRLWSVAVWLLVLAVPSILDRVGWRIRIGMAWLAAEQRRRIGDVRLPRTPAGAERWLDQSAAKDAGLTQASVAMIAGDLAEARRLVESYDVADAEDRARVARMLAGIDGLERGQVDPAAANTAIDALPAETQRYHRLSLAWSIAWVDVMNGRPWRRAFAEASRGLSARGIPARYVAYGVFQELLLPIVGALVVLVLLTVWPG